MLKLELKLSKGLNINPIINAILKVGKNNDTDNINYLSQNAKICNSEKILKNVYKNI